MPSLWQLAKTNAFSCKIIARCTAVHILKCFCMQIFAILSFKEKRESKDFTLFLKNVFLIGCKEKNNIAALFIFFKASNNVSSRKVKQISLQLARKCTWALLHLFHYYQQYHIYCFFQDSCLSQFYVAQIATFKRKHGWG